MKVLSGIAALALLFAPTVPATGSPQGRDPSPSPTVSNAYGPGPQASVATVGSPSPSAPSNSNVGQMGDNHCVSSMCVQAVVLGGNVQYTLSSRRSNVGWLAIGFGTQMAGSPMVIMWSNPDGSITLSQRQAAAEVLPSVVPNPPRVATVLTNLSVTTGNTPQYAFTIPANSDTKQNLIYAYGSVKPSSSSPGATLVQHIDEGTFSLDLTKIITANSPSPTNIESASGNLPLSSADKTILAHAIIATIGFVLFLPIGALIPRYLRTFVAGPTWFKSHWIVQFLIGGITIVIGVSLGLASVSTRGVPHANTPHKRLGIALFALYFLQLGVGAFIHWVKPGHPRKRPAQNYFHAILGILIIAIALAQVRLGFRSEWATATGRMDVPSGINVVWYIWVVLLPVAYGVGLAFLPKQYAQEQKARVSAGYTD